MRKHITTLLGMTVVAVVACTSDGSNAAAAAEAEAACVKSYDAAIERAKRCGLDYGKPAWERADAIDWCKAQIMAPGSGLTAKIVSACTDAMSKLTPCHLARDPEECTSGPGTLPDGSPCAVGKQCSSGSCSIDFSKPPPRCGTCDKRSRLGEPCNAISPSGLLVCAAGLACTGNVCVKSPFVVIPAGGECTLPSANDRGCAADTYCTATGVGTGVCAPYPKKGEPCISNYCDSNLICSGGVCVDPVDVGGACTSNECKPSLQCDPIKKRCVAPVLGNEGESCFAGCVPGFVCGPTKTCVALKKRGEACGPGETCSSFLECISGVCVLSDWGLCR